MKSMQMSTSLGAYAGLLHRAGCVQAGNDLQALATVFAAGGDQTVAAIVKKIAKNQASADGPTAHPALLKSLLEHIAAASRVAGATSIAKDYEATISLFSGSSDGSAHMFVDGAISALRAPMAPRRQSPPLDRALISEFVASLSDASGDNARFDAIVAELKAPRKFSNTVLAAIANAYLGTERTYKTKTEILKAITNHQLQHALQGSRDRRIIKIAV